MAEKEVVAFDITNYSKISILPTVAKVKTGGRMKNTNKLQAAIIDLDGVITKTAVQHAKAWKKMFDEYNEQRKAEGKEAYSSFTIEDDYPMYIDGIPRNDGVREFLKSRDIKLPEGTDDDRPGKETVYGLGNWKNEIFHEIIRQEGVDVFEYNIEAIKSWKKQGMKTAVISSSKNCKAILEATGLEHLFHVRVDGITSVERNIKGKPAPDIFLEAAKDLNVNPENALIVEDSRAGVEAGKKGGFGLIVGIGNGQEKKELLNRGADIVVKNLKDLKMEYRKEQSPEDLPRALNDIEEIKNKFKNNKVLFFLDFDGTLAPIVEYHEDACMSDEMKKYVKEISEKYSISVISGRGLSDVKKRVEIPDIFYAGSHGFEISGPDNFYLESEEAQKILFILDQLEPELKLKLKEIEGVRFERKKFTLAIHYRQVNEEKQNEVIEKVDEVVQFHEGVKAGEGKKVMEIRPDIDWHKGKAVEMLIQELAPDNNNILPVYIGDDITDEDAFESLENGIGILVGKHGRKTLADYYLNDVDEVKEFFIKLLDN